MAGHLFITQGDLFGLSCDAVLIPSGSTRHNRKIRYGQVTSSWQPHVAPYLLDGEFLEPAPTPAQPLKQIAPGKRSGRQASPAIWAGLTGDRAHEPLAFYEKPVRRFIARAGQQARQSAGTDRKPLLAMPLIGSGAGGRAPDKGGLLKDLVKAIVKEAQRKDVDVVLVLWDDAAYAAAQQARHASGANNWRDHLEESHVAQARALAGHARRRELVLFLGAGASRGAGLPSWKELLTSLAKAAGLGAQERKALLKLPYPDAARIITARMGGAHQVGEAVADLMRVPRASLVHQLLASLPVQEAVTTNYDALFEQAWEQKRHAKPRILPGNPERDDPAWLLKLHGSVDEPRSIVLSRDDYLRFETQGVALAGIVQAMLLTRHMLFFGYSLSDDNFHRLVHQLRTAVGSPSVKIGTAITTQSASIGDALWDSNIEFVRTGDTGPRHEGERRAAIFLDALGAFSATPTMHLLDDSYQKLYTPQQHKLGRILRELSKLSKELDPPDQEVVNYALEQLVGPEPHRPAAPR